MASYTLVHLSELELKDTTDTRRLRHALIFSAMLTHIDDTLKCMIKGIISTCNVS